jgi:threonine/homoserine/homoserine lactone efflux protein
LAIRIVRDRSPAALPPRDCDRKTYRNVYRDGVLVNVLNPKVSLLMLAILPQFVHVARGNVSAQIVTLGTLHVMIASCVLVLIVAAATRTVG